MTFGSRPRGMLIGVLALAACMVGLVGQASAAPDRVKVGPDLYLQRADDDSARTARPAESVDRGDQRIVGGAPTTIAQFPWQVAVAVNPALAPPGSDGFDRQFCGGTLVAPNVVITAAHCVDDGSGTFPFTADSHTAISGRTTLSTSEGQESVWTDYYFFVDGAGNPLYNPATSEYDAVFATLSSPSSSQPVQVAGADETATWAANQPAFISGWGDLAFNAGLKQDALRAARVQIIADSTCAGPGSYGAGFNPSLMLCAGLPQGGVDSCQGDSGGPIVVPISGGGFRLVGDTSFGIGCGQAEFPGVYGRIAGGTPMGDALQAGIQEATGHNVYGSGAQPLAVPAVKFTKKPNKVKTRKRKAKVKFRFTSNEPSATYTCELDNKPAAPCTSPYKKRVKRGKHKLSIVGTNFIGDVGAAKTDRFKVKRKRNKRR